MHISTHTHTHIPSLLALALGDMTKAKRLHWKQGAPASISRYSQAAPTKAGQGPLKFSTTPVEVLEPVFHLFFWNPSSQDFLISPNYKLCFYSMQIPLYHQSLQACGDWSCMIIQGPRQKKVASPRLSTGALAEEAWPELDIGVGIQLLSLWLDDWGGFAWGPWSWVWVAGTGARLTGWGQWLQGWQWGKMSFTCVVGRWVCSFWLSFSCWKTEEVLRMKAILRHISLHTGPAFRTKTHWFFSCLPRQQIPWCSPQLREWVIAV